MSPHAVWRGVASGSDPETVLPQVRVDPFSGSGHT